MGRHKVLLGGPDVKRWCDNLARDSVATAEVRMHRLGVYCGRAGTTPSGLAGRNR